MEEKIVVFTTELVNEIKDKFDQGYQIPQHHKFWLGNMPNVKKAGLKMSLTNEERMEYTKCKLGTVVDGKYISGLEYFAGKYCRIKREDGSIGPLTLRDYQEDILKLYNDNRFSILMGSRQIGKCVSFDTVVDVAGVNVPMYKLWFNFLEKKTVYDYLKHGLYTAIMYLQK